MAAPLMSSNAEAAASNAAKYGFRAWQASKARPPATAKEATIGIRDSTQTVKEVNGAPKQLTSNVGKTAGRNSAGRITIFHRGGGAKRLYRRIDMKRSTSAMGIVERIEYDPNRSSRIALVRWVEGAHLSFRKKCKAVEEKFAPPQKIFEPITATTRGQFSLALLSRDVDQMDKASSAPRKTGKYAVVGLQSALLPGSKNLSAINGAKSKKTCARDVFLSTFSTQRPKRETAASFAFNASFNIPRIAVAGAKPPLFASRRSGKDEEKSTFSLSGIQKWNQQSKLWANRSKRKAAISWQSFRWQYSSGFVGDADCDKLNPGTNCVSLPEGDASKSSSQKL